MSTPLTGIDTAWYRMETPVNPMMVTGLIRFDGQVDLARLRRLVAGDLATRYPRFRQRVVGARRPRWSDDPAFDPDDHIEVRPWPGDLPGLVSELVSTPLDRSRPLWHLTVVHAPDGDVLVIRIAHCIADGVALARMILGLADEEPELPVARTRKSRPGAAAVVGLAARALLTLPRLALLPRASRSALRAPLSGTKRVVWSEPIPLDDVKRAGSTVNDVLLDALTSGLRRVLGDAARDLRVAIPVDLRDPAAPVGLGNRFGLVFLDLPVGVAAAAGRRSLLQRRMDALKSSPEAHVTLFTLGVLGRLPSVLLHAAIRLLGSKVTMVLTNVPGPRAPLRLAGSVVRELQYWVPQTDGVGLGVSILSYAGQVTIGVAADVAVLPDPDRLLAAVREELAPERLHA